MSALDRVMLAAGATPTSPPEELSWDPGVEFALAAQMLGDAWLTLASDPDNDGDDDSSEEGDTDDDAGHTGHALFKKLRGKMGDKAAAKMCAKADAKKKVAASMVSNALVLMGAVELSVTQAERDKAHEAGNSLPDKSYPINNAKQLHSAAVLAASGHGNVKAATALIRKRAKELGVDVNTLPGFGSSDDGEKMAASMLALAGAPMGEPPMSTDHSGAMNHGNSSGSHSHPHVVAAVHSHGHFHNNDNRHEDHHPGVPGRRW